MVGVWKSLEEISRPPWLSKPSWVVYQLSIFWHLPLLDDTGTGKLLWWLWRNLNWVSFWMSPSHVRAKGGIYPLLSDIGISLRHSGARRGSSSLSSQFAIVSRAVFFKTRSSGDFDLDPPMTSTQKKSWIHAHVLLTIKVTEPLLELLVAAKN